MMASTSESFIWGPGGQRLTPEEVARLREQAEAMQAAGMDFSPVGSWLEGAARVAQGAAGAFKEYRANNAQREGQQAWNDKYGGIISSLMGGGSTASPMASSYAPSASTGGMPSAGIHGTPGGIGDTPIPDSYFASIRSAESSGNDAAKNPNSSATGRYQFTSGTWSDLANKYPSLGLTSEGRLDPTQQELAIQAFTMDNAGILKNYGIPINGGSLYAAHFLGAGDAPRVLSAPPETLMTSLVPGKVIEANPFLANMTAGDFAQWAAKKGGEGSAAAQATDMLAYAPQSMPAAPSPAIPGDAWVLPGGANPRAPQAAPAVAPSPQARDVALALAGPQGGQTPMPSQHQRPVNTAGMNYDPATGRIGPAAGLNAGATLAPAASQAFLGTGQAGSWSDPIRAVAQSLAGGGQPQPAQTAPSMGATGPVGGAPAPMPAQPAGMPQGNNIGALIAAASDPYAPPGVKEIVNTLVQQQLQQQDPAYRMGLEKSQLELEQLRNPKVKPIEVGGVLLDPTTYQPIYDSRQNENRPTDDMREYDAAKAQGFTGTLQDWLLSQKKAGAATTSINMGEGDKFYENLDKKNAETFAALSDSGMQARAKMAKVGRLKELLATAPQGPVAALKQAAGEWGINTEGLNDIQAASSIIESLVPQQRAPGSGPMSDADIAMYRASLPRLINQPGGNEVILNTLAGIAQYEAEMGNIADQVADRTITPAEGRKRIRELKNPLEGFKAQAGTAPQPTSTNRSTLGLGLGKSPVVINGYQIEEVQ